MAEVRFKPPPIALTPEIRWLLEATFSSLSPIEPFPRDPERVLALAQRLGLTERIWARQKAAPRPELIPEPVSEDFRQAYLRSVIRIALFEETAKEIATVAHELSIHIVFLKGFALFLSGKAQKGGRPFGDLDVLAPEHEVEQIHSELLRRGFEPFVETGNEQHLAPLAAPHGGRVDLHFCIRGLAFEAARWATVGDLRERDLLRRVEGFSGDCSVPDIEAQTAHLLVHGLAHHIWRPQRYPLLRLIGDVQELLPDGAAWESFLSGFQEILTVSVPPPELAAMRDLTLELSAGRIPDSGAGKPSDPARLLGHMMAGSLDEKYAASLRLRHSLGRLGDAARQGRLMHYLARRVRRERVD